MAPFDRLRARPAWVMPALAGLVVAGALVYQQRSLEQLAESVQGSSTTVEVQSLGERLSTLEQFNDTQQKQPTAITLEQLSDLRREFEAQVTILDVQLADRAAASELQMLKDSVEAVSASVQKLEAEKTAQRPATRAPKPVLKEPPFTVLGIEVRGGHRFVAISPQGRPGPEHIQLLRIGDHFLGWHLESIEPQAVVFRTGELTRRLDVR
ncbi:hypothetical protein [Pseudomonas sp. NPDC089401]|uniref:hypothetical protein n=1 Tax=Pseudomonas sp. NPDC089401 TaxID=3364462 RepID=UPI0037F336EC